MAETYQGGQVGQRGQAGGAPSQTFRCDAARVAHEMVDGEVIAIDFQTGAYFSMQRSAAQIWDALIGGASRGALRDAAIAQGGADAGAQVDQFVDTLVALDLMQPANDAPVLLAGAVRLADYAPPIIEKFEDMAELMMLDPIHDVAPQGWPHA